jgi:hypothetical protein
VQLFVELHLLVAFLFLDPGVTGIANHSQQTRAAILSSKRVEGPERAQVCFLHYVFRMLAIPR